LRFFLKYSPKTISAMRAAPPIAAPMPALAPVERPDEESLVLRFVLGSAEVGEGVDETEVDAEAVAEAIALLAEVDDTPSN
jgi:hypothetical protein